MASQGDFSYVDCILAISTLRLEELDDVRTLGPWMAVLPARWSWREKVKTLWQYVDVCGSRIVVYANVGTKGYKHRDLIPIRGDGARKPAEGDPLRRELEILVGDERSGDRQGCLDAELQRIWTKSTSGGFLSEKRALELVRRT